MPGEPANWPLREQFEEMTADLLERTAYTSRQLLAAAGLQWKDLNHILLIGGATRMPMVPAMLQKMTGIQPDRTVNPDEAVARGAAIYASYLLAKQTEGGPPPNFEVTNVNAHSLGVEGIEQETLRKTNVIVIPRNTPLPARRTEWFITKSEGQRSIAIQVLEGESSLPDECMAIGRTVVRDLPAGLPHAWPVEVTFEYGSNGRLHVRALVPGTHHQAELELERDVGLSDAGLARWKVPIAAGGGFDGFEAAAAAPAETPATPMTPASLGILRRTAANEAPMALPPSLANKQILSAPLPLEVTPLPPTPLLDEAKPESQSAPVLPAPSGQASDLSQPPPLLKVKRPKRGRRLLAGALARVVGHIIVSLLGLGCGLLLLRWLRPDLIPPLW